MNIASIYPNGLEKRKPCTNANNTTIPELKEKALEMLGKGMTIKYVSQALGIPISTMAFWKRKASY